MQYQFLIAPKKSATSKSVSEDEPDTSSLTLRVSIHTAEIGCVGIFKLDVCFGRSLNLPKTTIHSEELTWEELPLSADSANTSQ